MKLYSITTMILMCATLGACAQAPKIIAHRGAWKNTQAPQNSIASLQKAIEQGVWGSEFDVHLTKDNTLVVCHDQDFYGIDIATATYEELLTKTHPNGEKIPTAEAYLREGLKQKNTRLIFEIKSNKLGVDRTLEATEMCYKLVKKLKAEKEIVFIAFSYPACLKLRELDAKVKIQYLNGDKTPEQLKQDRIYGLDYNAGVLKKNTQYVEQAKKLGIKTNVWTVNTEEDMQYFIQQGVDYITTDQPELLKQILKK
ncbi:glycerophosphodiester phosphodiesterase [Sphingobacterium sp. SGG-5]|uniref:glycerophosphodiester phosphodiesterase n=1 Tax=Sphingobacterium sp. SGG-5 TaxID=2710881 RepID=UPI0013EC8141|nr:glycerophosphodiester phosphodiesterase family protein [Sphingobacterium sp. SGG-5]NGM60733.1 glycerophosphodiester phosphodiesterase [Sphingobacterium sp. SGG-5]